MKSRTSSSKFRVFKKDLTRFAPVWVEYSVVLLIIHYFFWNADASITDRYSWFVGAFAFVNAIYGFVCAASLFGYLTDPKECNMVHTFPIRREEYFLIHTAAGLLMALVPNGIFCLMNLPYLQETSMFYIFGGMMLEFVFFYGLAIFSMFLTGKRFAAATVYALLNWLSLLVMWAVDTIYLPTLPGIQLNTSVFYEFCPVIRMSFENLNSFTVFHGMQPSQMTAIAVYALVGVGLMGASLLIYRRRKLEYAGDFIAVKWLTPVFIVALSVTFGCVLAMFGSIFDSNYFVLLAIGLVVGYFTGMMLLKKTVKVFNPKNLGGAVAVLALIFGSIFITSLDPANRVYHVPEANEVASVEIRDNRSSYGNAFESEDPSVIANVVALHQDILDSGNLEESYPSRYFKVTYKLKNGKNLIRYYWVKDDSLEQRVGYYFSQPEFLMDVSSLEELQEKCQYLEVYDYNYYKNEEHYYPMEGEQKQAFLEIFFRECREGKMNSHGNTTSNDLGLSIGIGDSMNTADYYWITIPNTAVDTIAFCDQLAEQDIQE